MVIGWDDALIVLVLSDAPTTWLEYLCPHSGCRQCHGRAGTIPYIQRTFVVGRMRRSWVRRFMVVRLLMPSVANYQNSNAIVEDEGWHSAVHIGCCARWLPLL